VRELERAMWEAVEKLDFERAAAIRDMIAGEKRKESGEGKKAEGKKGEGNKGNEKGESFFSAGKKTKPQNARRRRR